MTRQKLKAAMALMSDRDNAARDVAAQLGVPLSTLYAYVDAKGRPRERATELLGKRASKSAVAVAVQSQPVPVSFLSDAQASRYGRFDGDPTPEQLARFFHLDDADRAFVGEHRGDHNRLGVAVQLGALRLLGTMPEDVRQTPASVARFAGDQLAMTGTAGLMRTYVASAGRWRHGPRIRERYGYRQFTDFGVAFRLNRFLYAVCWTGTDRP